jgi:hypothetical protein
MRTQRNNDDEAGPLDHCIGSPDMPAIHIFKIWGGRIDKIEAIGIVTDFTSPTGWE